MVNKLFKDFLYLNFTNFPSSLTSFNIDYQKSYNNSNELLVIIEMVRLIILCTNISFLLQLIRYVTFPHSLISVNYEKLNKINKIIQKISK